MQETKFGFTAGEFSPSLWGVSDLARYAQGAAGLENWAVKHTGSIETRYPLRFVEFTQDPDAAVRFFSFEFSNSLDNAYLVVFGDGWIRFVRDGGYIIETAVNASGVSSGVVTSTGHGYSNGDMVYLTGFPNAFVVASATTNAYTLHDIEGNVVAVNTGAVTSQRVYTLTHAYAAVDLAALKSDQVFDTIKFTHPDYPVMLLRRLSAGWEFVAETRQAGVPLSGSASATSSGAFIKSVRVTAKGSAYTDATVLTVSDATGSGAKLTPTIQSGSLVGVTIVEGGKNYTAPTISADVGTGATFEITLAKTEAEVVVAASAVVDGAETGIFRPAVITGLPDITQTQGTYTFSVPAVPEAELYNYYRSIVYPFPDQGNIGVELGWIGASRAAVFTDNNIVPDFTRTPRFFYDPFEPGQILTARPTAGGSGYAQTDTLTVSGGGGSGAVLYPIVEDGVIIGVYIANGGKGYSSPTISVTTSGGSGATFAVTVDEATGTYPAVAFTFQQRAGYAATRNRPMTLWASRVEEFDNFAAAEVLDATDPYSYTLDAKRVSRIRHALPVQQGLLLFTRDFVSLLRAGEGNAVTALNGVLDPQSYIGSTEVPPVVAAEDIIYVQEKSRGLRLLAFNPVARRFDGTEISLLSRHLFESSAVRALTMAMNTENRGYGVFENGAGFICTIHREQEIFAFAPMTTRGILEDVAAVDVGSQEHIYFAVRRGNRRSIEYMRPYETMVPEDAVALDARISTDKVFPAATITVSATTGVVTVTATANVFAVGDVGKLFFAGSGRGIVTAYTSPTVITVTLTRPVLETQYQTTLATRFPVGSWWMNPLVSSVSGIPFEGETVAVVADGKRQEDKVVSGGTVTLDSPGAIIHIGFPYKARLRTLPPPGSEGKPINVIGASVYYRRVGTMSLGVGNDAPYPQPLRTDEEWFEPTDPTSADRFAYLDGSWVSGGNVVLDVEDGRHAEILRVSVFYDLGGDVVDPPSE